LRYVLALFSRATVGSWTYDGEALVPWPGADVATGIAAYHAVGADIFATGDAYSSYWICDDGRGRKEETKPGEGDDSEVCHGRR